MEEKRISKQQFEAAMDKVMSDMLKDEKLSGMSKLLVPLMGTKFAIDMIAILFPDEQDTKENTMGV